MKSYKGKIKTLKGIGERLRLARKQSNYSAREMAERLGLNYNSYYKNENSATYPGLSTLYRLSEDHDISMDWLLFGKGSMYCLEKEKRNELAEPDKEPDQIRDKADAQKKKTEEFMQKPELKDLLQIMEKIPMVYHAVLEFYWMFKAKNIDVLRKELKYQEQKQSNAPD